MGEPGGTVEYLYWSARRTGRFVEDNNLAAQQVTRTITSSRTVSLADPLTGSRQDQD